MYFNLGRSIWCLMFFCGIFLQVFCWSPSIIINSELENSAKNHHQEEQKPTHSGESIANLSSDETSSKKIRAKRDAFDMYIKKKGLGAAATALLAAASFSKKKFLPIPIPFPLPILKPPIIEPFPMPLLPFAKGGGFAGGLGFGGYGR